MTANPFAALLRDVPIRYDFDPVHDYLRLDLVLATLAAAVPADLAEAEHMAQRLLNEHDAFSGHAADTIRSLIALATAQAARIEGLTKERRVLIAIGAQHLLAEDAATAEVTELRQKLQAMHRRAQKAEGLSQRSAALLETVMRSIKEVIPMLPTLPDPYPLSLHSLFHRVRAARDHARASSGRAWIEGWHYYHGKLEAAESALAAERAKVAKLVGALKPFADIGIGTDPDYQPMIRMDRDAIITARAAITEAQQ